MLTLTKQPESEVIMAESILPIIRPCIKCGAVERRITNGRCIPCEKRQSADRYERNKERAAENQRLRIAAHPEKHKSSKDKWRSKNRDRVIETQSAYNKKNKKRLDEAKKLWLLNNKERVAKTREKWIAANKEVRASYNHTRRAMREMSGGRLSRNIVKRLLLLQKGLCPCCRKPLGDKYHLDHIVPLVMGGSNTDDNVQLLRAECNLQKGRKHPVDFMQERGLLL